MLKFALAYAQMGYAVFPCLPNGKRPACKHGLKEATSAPAQIRQWWNENPRYNIGLSTSGLLVVDVDPEGLDWPGRERAASIKQLTPPLQRTPRGGWHIVFRRPLGVPWRCTAGQLAKGVDTRTDGGYIVVAPSRSEHGQYRWIRPLRPISELPTPPDWLCGELDCLCQPRERQPYPLDLEDGPIFEEGCRNVGLTRWAGKLRRLGFSQKEIEEMLMVTNRLRCRPPLPSQEVLAIARSISRYPAGRPTERKWRGHFTSRVVLGE